MTRSAAILMLVALPLGCGSGGAQRDRPTSPARTATHKAPERPAACPRPAGDLRRLSFDPRCWNITGTSTLVAGTRPHLALRSGCVSTAAAGVRLPLRLPGRWRLSWKHAGGRITRDCLQSAVAVVFMAGTGGRVVLDMKPVLSSSIDLDIPAVGNDKVVLQFWLSGGLRCGGVVRIWGIELTRLARRSAARRVESMRF